MHIADSLRQKASSKIAAGGITDARDNAGGFSAAVRMKSNQYMLQSKRVNIQNSLTFLQAQRDAITQARDTMDKIGILKLKFDDPTLNSSDKANINTEFKKLALDLYNIRSQSFNGQPLFAESEEASSVMYGGKETGLPSGTGSEGSDAKVTLHGVDFQDIDSVYKAGEAVRRGLGGLDYVNFADQEVRQQEELVTISGGIAEGDTFSFFLNQKTQIGETLNTADNNLDVDGNAGNDSGSPHLISYTATLDDENSADPHKAIVDGLKAVVDNLLGVTPEGAPQAFVAASVQADSANSKAYLFVKSTNAGVPFELHGESSTGSTGRVTLAETSGNGLLPEFAANDAEEKTLALDLKDDDGLNSGYVLKGGDSVSLRVDNVTKTFAPTQAEINAEGARLSLDFSDPTNFIAASEYMLNGLRGVINAEADVNANFKVRATSVTTPPGEDVAEITIKSTHRGDPLTNPTLSFNLAGDEQEATGSTVTITKSRVAEAGDQVRIRRSINNFVQGGDTLTFTQGAPGDNGFTDFNDLRDKIHNHPDNKYEATLTNSGNSIEIKDRNPQATAGIADPSDTNNADGTDRVQNVTLTVTQGQTDYVTAIAPSAGTTLFADKGDSFTNLNTVKSGGSGNNSLQVGFNITKTTGVVDTTAANLVVNAAGSGYAKNDQFTVAGTEIGDTDGNSITFRVEEVTGNVSAFNVNTFNTTVNDKSFANRTLATNSATGSGVTANVAINSGVVTATITAATGTFLVGETVTISGTDIGGTAADDITLTIGASDLDGSGALNLSALSSTGATSVTDSSFTGVNALTTTTNSADGNGLRLDVNIVSGVLTASVATGLAGTQYKQGDTITIAGTDIGGSAADNVTLTVQTAGTEVVRFSHVLGQAQSNWTVTGTENSFQGSGLQITASAGRDGVLTVDSIDNGGQGYAINNNRDIDLTGDGVTASNKDFDITAIQSDFSDAKETDLNSGGRTTTDAERGDQFIAEGGNSAAPQASDDASFSEVTADAVPNVVGENRVRTVSINADKKLNGTGNDSDRIHVGDVFSITVKEVLHPDEDSGAWPESNTDANTHGEGDRTGSEHEITATYTAVAGDTEDTVAANLLLAFDTQRTALTTLNPLADDDLPTGVVSGNTITFTSNRPGEDFGVSWNQALNPDVIVATGAINDPNGTQSHVGNISPFSIEKSLNYFTEMLSQNAAETSRLMKAQEHLENSIVNTEQAWGKLNDTDYAKASTEQVRESMKVQMANNIIGKSIRMNDLLVDLTTKHHRGAILNARA
jgi:flagellin-like hook-associated protein FlgL